MGGIETTLGSHISEVPVRYFEMRTCQCAEVGLGNVTLPRGPHEVVEKNGRVNAGDGRGRAGMMDVLRQWNRH